MMVHSGRPPGIEVTWASTSVCTVLASAWRQWRVWQAGEGACMLGRCKGGPRQSNLVMAVMWHMVFVGALSQGVAGASWQQWL